ncbi:MAG: SDR family oxidoreductase [Bacteroidetes bacterium]|nr:SDR family oxidoreductase [Bacteroidota bacterium]
MENKSKIALVTGGSRGLGRDMAIRLAEKGIDIILTYNSRDKEAMEVVGLVQQAGRKAVALQLNTGNIGSFDAFVGQVREVLKNTFQDEFLNVHFKGVYFLTQKSLGLLNDGGGIINISSGQTRMTLPRYSIYASMKTAVETFTRFLAVELGPRRIRANVVAPGAIQTDFSGGIVRDNPEVNKHISEITALGRPGVAEDIGGVVAFLCTEDARWVNAQRIEVSGGQHL